MNNNSRLGLYYKDELNDKYKDDSITFLRYKIFDNYSSKGIDTLSTVFVHPVGWYCKGSCEYCYVSCSDIAKKKIILTNDEYVIKLKEINNRKLFVEVPTIRFTGGDPLLHPDIFSLIKSTELVGFNKYKLRWTVDLMNTKEQLNNFKETLRWSINNNKIENIIIAITVDLGSDTRYSKSLNINTPKIINNAIEICEEFGNNEKVFIDIITNFSAKTDIQRLLKELNYFYKRDFCRLIIKPVNSQDPNYYTTGQYMNEIINKIENIYGPMFVVNRKELAIESNYTKKTNKIDAFSNPFIKLDNSTFMLNPYKQPCTAYNTACGFNNDNWFACFYGRYLSKNLDGVLKLSSSMQHFEIFTKLPNNCLKCDMLGVCMRCRNWRRFHKCEDFEYLKLWEKIIWERVFNNKETVRVVDLNGQI